MSNDVDKIKPRTLKLNGSLDDERMIEIVNRSKQSNDSPSKNEKLIKLMQKSSHLMNLTAKITLGSKKETFGARKESMQQTMQSPSGLSHGGSISLFETFHPNIPKQFEKKSSLNSP